MPEHRCPAPWQVDEETESFIVCVAKGQVIALQRQSGTWRLTCEETRCIAAYIA